jgi:hypothetical protein
MVAVCSSSIYGFCSPLWYLQTLLEIISLQETHGTVSYFEIWKKMERIKNYLSLRSEQHRRQQKSGVNPGALKGEAVPVSYETPVVLQTIIVL